MMIIGTKDKKATKLSSTDSIDNTVYANATNRYMLYAKGDYSYATKNKKNNPIDIITSFPNYNVVFFAVHNHKCSYGTRHKRQFYNFCGDAFLFNFLRKSLVWILLSVRRASGMRTSYK